MILTLAACTPEPVELGPSTTTLPVEPGWEDLAPTPRPRQECGVVVWRDQIVIVGGYDEDTFVDEVWACDPATDTWSDLPPLPRAVHHPNVVVLGDGLHVAGSLVEGFAAIADHWRLDDDGWDDLDPIPVAVGGSGVAALDGQIHLIGGLGAGGSLADHQVFDGDGWTTLPDAPTARDHFLLVAAGDGLVALAGRAGGIAAFTAHTDVWVGDTWRRGAPIPTPRGGAMGAVDDEGRVHVLGGEGDVRDPNGVFGAHEVYDPDADTWTALGPMPNPRHGTGGAWLDGALYVPGGAPVQAFGAADTHDRWVP